MMNALQAITALSTAIGLLQHIYNKTRDDGLGNTIQTLVALREIIRRSQLGQEDIALLDFIAAFRREAVDTQEGAG